MPFVQSDKVVKNKKKNKKIPCGKKPRANPEGQMSSVCYELGRENICIF